MILDKLARRIKSWIVAIAEKGAFGSLVYHRIKYTTAKALCFLIGEKCYAKWFYHLYTEKKLNLDNPRYFDEKLWWLKLNNRDPLLTVCSDKIAVRDYVKKCGYEDILIPQLDIFRSADELDMSKYDCEVVVKCNHNSGGHMFYNPQRPLTGKEISIHKKELNFILHQNASVLSREWNYKNIKPAIIVEKVIRDKKGNLPLDYKFMCFGGEPKLLFLDLGVINPDSSYNHHYPRNIYDMDFNLLPVHETRPNADYPVEKPENFEKMIEIARRLAKDWTIRCKVYS